MKEFKAGVAPANKINYREEDVNLLLALERSQAITNPKTLADYIFQNYYQKIKTAADGRLKLIKAVDGEDAFQYVSMTLCTTYQRIDPEKFGKGYLFTMVHNFCNGYYREYINNPIVEDDDRLEKLTAKQGDSEENYLLEKINKFLLTLVPTQREVFELYMINNFSHEMIASTLEISISGSKTRLHQARQKLKKWLASENI
ncbi:MAG: sigma-70 family RNA polymerase sigma factor [Bacteroidota bacterium]